MVIQYDPGTDSWSSWFGILTKVPSASQEAITTLSELQKRVQQGFNTDNYDSFIQDSNLADKSLIAFLKDTEYGTKDLASYQEYLKNTASATSLFETITKKAGSVVKSFGATLANMALMYVATFVAGKVIEFIDNTVHASEKAQEAIEGYRSEYEEASSQIDSMNSELESTQEKIDDLQSKGVLTFTDKEELQNLKEQNDELERSIKLEEKKKEEATNKAIAKFRGNQEKFFDDSDKHIKALQDNNRYYERQKKNLREQYDAGLLSEEDYNTRIAYMDEKNAKYRQDILNDITKLQDAKQDLLNKYGTDDSSQYTVDDKDLYNKIVTQLQDAYKQVYDDNEYNKIVIEPIFDTDKFKDLYGELLKYLATGNPTDLKSLELRFGKDIITALRNACENAGIDFDEMIGDMSENAQNNIDKIAPMSNRSKNGRGGNSSQNKISSELRSYIYNDLSDEDRTLLLTAEIPDDVKFKTTKDIDNFIASLNEEAGNTPIEFKSFKKYFLNHCIFCFLNIL